MRPNGYYELNSPDMEQFLLLLFGLSTPEPRCSTRGFFVFSSGVCYSTALFLPRQIGKKRLLGFQLTNSCQPRTGGVYQFCLGFVICEITDGELSTARPADRNLVQRINR